MKRKVDVEEFKEELWDMVVEFGEPLLELLDKRGAAQQND